MKGGGRWSFVLSCSYCSLFIFLCLIGCGDGVTTTTQSVSGTSVELTAFDIYQTLSIHNYARSTINTVNTGKYQPQPFASLPNISWDASLARIWNSRAAQSCSLTPTDYSLRAAASGLNDVRIGESIIYSLSPDVPSLVNSWYNQRFNYSYHPSGAGDFPNANGTFEYSQMIWSNTQYIGCALINCTTAPLGGFIFACNYYPAGNYLYELPYACVSPATPANCSTLSLPCFSTYLDYCSYDTSTSSSNLANYTVRTCNCDRNVSLSTTPSPLANVSGTVSPSRSPSITPSTGSSLSVSPSRSLNSSSGVGTPSVSPSINSANSTASASRSFNSSLSASSSFLNSSISSPSNFSVSLSSTPSVSFGSAATPSVGAPSASPSCAPITCAYFGTVTCGQFPNNCGGTLECGSCPTGQQCRIGNCFNVTFLNTTTYTPESTVALIESFKDGPLTPYYPFIPYESSLPNNTWIVSQGYNSESSLSNIDTSSSGSTNTFVWRNSGQYANVSQSTASFEVYTGTAATTIIFGSKLNQSTPELNNYEQRGNDSIEIQISVGAGTAPGVSANFYAFYEGNQKFIDKFPSNTSEVFGLWAANSFNTIDLETYNDFASGLVFQRLFINNELFINDSYSFNISQFPNTAGDFYFGLTSNTNNPVVQFRNFALSTNAGIRFLFSSCINTTSFNSYLQSFLGNSTFISSSQTASDLECSNTTTNSSTITRKKRIGASGTVITSNLENANQGAQAGTARDILIRSLAVSSNPYGVSSAGSYQEEPAFGGKYFDPLADQGAYSAGEHLDAGAIVAIVVGSFFAVLTCLILLIIGFSALWARGRLPKKDSEEGGSVLVKERTYSVRQSD